MAPWRAGLLGFGLPLAVTLAFLTLGVRVSFAMAPVRHAAAGVAGLVRRAAAALPAGSGPGAVAAASDWVTFGGGLGNDFSAGTSLVNLGDVGSLRPAWNVSAGAEVAGEPVVAAGRVFFSTTGGRVYAVDTATGRVEWSRILDGSPIDAGALYDGGRLFVATSGGEVAALDPATGAVLWTAPGLFLEEKDALRASPRAYGGVLYESLGGTDDDAAEAGGVVALNEATGQVLWRTMLVRYAGGGAAVFSPPAVLPRLGELVVGTGNPTPTTATDAPDDPPPGSDQYSDSLVALSLQDGHVLWSAQTLSHDPTDADFLAAPNVVALPGGRTAVGDGEKNGSYYLVDASTGLPIWRADLALPTADTLIVATGAVAGGRIFTGTMDVPDPATQWPANYQAPGTGRLVALDALSGRTLWSDPLPATLAAAPVVGDGVLFAVLADGAVIAVNPGTGSILWGAQAPGQIWNAEAALTLTGSTLYVPLAHPGSLAAYRLTGPAS